MGFPVRARYGPPYGLFAVSETVRLQDQPSIDHFSVSPETVPRVWKVALAIGLASSHVTPTRAVM